MSEVCWWCSGCKLGGEDRQRAAEDCNHEMIASKEERIDSEQDWQESKHEMIASKEERIEK